MAKRSKPVMRPEAGETMAYWPAKSRPPFSDADHPVDGDLDAEAGVVEAGPGLGADAGAEALRRGRAARWRVSARCGVSAQRLVLFRPTTPGAVSEAISSALA